MAYTKQTWADLPSKTTPINANRLTHIEDGIFNAAQTADTAASTAGTAAANVGIVSGKVETLTERVNGLDTAVSNKVDKVAGKGLSTNDYDNTDKGKVDSLGTASTKNSTSVVTESSDLVESGAVLDTLRDAEVTKGKNIFDKANVKSVSSGCIMSGTSDNLRLQMPSAGTYKSAFIYCYVKPHTNYTINTKAIISSGTAYVAVSDDNASDVLASSNEVSSGSLTFELHFNSKEYDKVLITLGCTRGTSVAGDITYKDTDVASYPLKNSKADNSVIAPVENGSTASQAYAVGSHAIRNGAFITWKNAKAQGETINDASDYTSGDVADELTTKTGSITPISGIDSDDMHVNQYGRVVNVSGLLRLNQVTFPPNVNTKLATISGVDKPSGNTRFTVVTPNTNPILGIITNNGDLIFSLYSGTSPSGISFNFTYMV